MKTQTRAETRGKTETEKKNETKLKGWRNQHVRSKSA